MDGAYFEVSGYKLRPIVQDHQGVEKTEFNQLIPYFLLSIDGVHANGCEDFHK